MYSLFLHYLINSSSPELLDSFSFSNDKTLRSFQRLVFFFPLEIFTDPFLSAYVFLEFSLWRFLISLFRRICNKFRENEKLNSLSFFFSPVWNNMQYSEYAWSLIKYHYFLLSFNYRPTFITRIFIF